MMIDANMDENIIGRLARDVQKIGVDAVVRYMKAKWEKTDKQGVHRAPNSKDQNEVEKWRGGFRSVSPSRFPNRTGGFPASGFPSRCHCA